jgi:hypothetical protein
LIFFPTPYAHSRSVSADVSLQRYISLDRALVL